MNINAIHPRLTRLQRECDVSVAPVLLLCAACLVLVVLLGLSALTDETISAQAGEPTQQMTSPAA
jgi:hypothetical protein